LTDPLSRPGRERSESPDLALQLTFSRIETLQLAANPDRMAEQIEIKTVIDSLEQEVLETCVYNQVAIN